MKIFYILIAICLAFVSLPAYAAKKSCRDFYSDLQCKNLTLAYQQGLNDDIENLMAGIILRETKAGASRTLIGERDKPWMERSYGLMQVQPKTAKDVLSAHPNLWPGKHTDRELVHKLLHDSHFNVKIAYYQLEFLRDKGLSWREMIAAYNHGIAGYKNFDIWSDDYTCYVVKHAIAFSKNKKFFDLDPVPTPMGPVAQTH